MNSLTNLNKIPLPVAVWAVDNTYDSVQTEKYISATALLKPIRSIVLGSKAGEDSRTDIADYIPSAMGTAIHSAIEFAWKERYKENLLKLGYPQNVVDRFRINPEPETIDHTMVNVFMEQRRIKELLGWKIGGKFDFIAEGLLHDFKSTSVYTWINNSNEEEYRLQGSIYRWLNPDLIKEDYVRICFIFTDWNKAQAERDKENYPQCRVMKKDITLLPLDETEEWIKKRIELIEYYMNKPDSEIPECTDKELWRAEPVFKYYSNPDNLTRATKRFNTLEEANAFKASKGKGVVITVLGTPRRCNYCNANSICEQRKRILPDDEFRDS